MKWFPQNQGLLIGFGTAALLMAGVNGLSYQNANQLIESTNRSRQTYEVIKNLVDVFSEMTVAESGRRGYVFLNDESELIRYRVAIRAMQIEIQSLQRQYANQPNKIAHLKQLVTLVRQRTDLLEESIRIYQRDRAAVAVQRSITTKSVILREQIQAVIADMQQEEDQLLQLWLKETQTSIHHRIWLEFLVTCFSFALLVVVCWLLYRQLVKRYAAEALGKTLEREKELSDLKLRFFSMVSHEFRTPLSIILGSAQMLAENHTQWSSDRRTKNIHRIQSSANLMTRYLTDILTLTRAEAGNLDYNPAPLDVEAFCLNLIEDLHLSEPGHTLTFQSQGRCGLVKLDEKLLFSILSNLLLNAMKYSAPGSPIQLRLSHQGQWILFEVTDTGIGIEPGDQPHLYKPFYRGGNTSDIEGTGLGLVVVKKCVELHGGEITVTSEVGVGTIFRVWLPERSPMPVAIARTGSDNP
ncbi:MAG: ATP-binding protein [Leptolyngbyaceae cyanobacterium bins.349]|nr:ATP-binding protein [Leptolyngbyaceae cyanobacterium bins.349]